MLGELAVNSAYFSDFDRFIKEGCYFYLECEYGKPYKLPYIEFFKGLSNNYKVTKKNLDQLVKTKYSYNHTLSVVIARDIYEKANRLVGANESIYMIRVYEPNKPYYPYYIPKKELSELMTYGDVLRSFVNVEEYLYKSDTYKIIGPTWYYPLNTGLESVVGINLKKGNCIGDLGQGFYMSKTKSEVEGYKLTGKKNADFKIVPKYWCSGTLDRIYFEVLAEGSKANGKKEYTREIDMGSGRKFRIKIFAKDCENWRKALWNGRVLGKRLVGYDMVIAPYPHDYLSHILAENREKFVKTGQDLEKEKEAFLKEEFVNRVKRIVKGSKVTTAFQLCIYNSDVFSNYIEKEPWFV